MLVCLVTVGVVGAVASDTDEGREETNRRESTAGQGDEVVASSGIVETTRRAEVVAGDGISRASDEMTTPLATPTEQECTIISDEAIVEGTEDDDVICLGDGRHVVYGHGGDDVIYGGRGQDIIDGGDGDDHLDGGGGSEDVLTGGPGTDSCTAALDADCEIQVTGEPTR